MTIHLYETCLVNCTLPHDVQWIVIELHYCHRIPQKNHVQSGPASMNRERASGSPWSLIALPCICMKMSSVKWRPFCLGLNVLTHYFRWFNAKEANPQCTEAASLVSFALSHPFVICHQLNITLYCASITTAHAFPFRVASMPAVRYDLSGGLPTCLWLFIYQDYSVICISKKLV